MLEQLRYYTDCEAVLNGVTGAAKIASVDVNFICGNDADVKRPSEFAACSVKSLEDIFLKGTIS